MASLTTAPVSLARLARPIHGEDELDQLLDLVAPARIVALGGASYGTHEHYDLRASLTRKLVADRGFAGVVIEADWPDALRIDRYVRNQSDDDRDSALAQFDHFPAWAWRNDVVARFVDWLRIQNCCRRPDARVGFYGLDVFSLNAARRASRMHLVGSDDDLVEELVDMQWRHAARSGRAPSGVAWLTAMQSPSVRHAKAYYRTLLAGGVEAWNLRAIHMADTLDTLAKELGSADDPARLVVWAHNAHVGDSNARDVAGKLSLGQCLRERHGDDVALVGFTTYEGTLRCAAHWDGPSSIERLEPARSNSWEALFHELGIPRFMITSTSLRRAAGEPASHSHRGIGAVLREDPYFEVRLADHYDVIVHADATRAGQPLTHVPDVGPCADAASTEFAG